MNELTMTAAEFRIAREDLGLTGDWLAEHWGITARVIRKWEAGTVPVPPFRAGQMAGLADEADTIGYALVQSLSNTPNPVLVIPREGERDGWPASWWRRVAKWVLYEVPDLRVTYAD